SGAATDSPHSPDRRAESLPLIPDYQLIERIGSGAYGEVWRARSVATGVYRAVKVVYRATFGEDRPFHREFEGIKKFEEVSRSHPSQLAVFHVGRGAGYFFYVMELADDAKVVEQASSLYLESPQSVPQSNRDEVAATTRGPETGKMPVLPYAPHTLRSGLAQGRLRAARVLELGLALTKALAHLHTQGLVHRDIKPSNIIFVNDRPKLADISTSGTIGSPSSDAMKRAWSMAELTQEPAP